MDFALTDFLKVMPNGKPLQRVEASVLTEAVDWVERENADRRSPLYRKVDVGHVGYVGQSCGGIQALGASLDRRTKTTVVLNSANDDFGRNITIPVKLERPALVDLDRLHAPIAYFIGGPADPPYLSANANFEAICHLPVLLANLPVGHTGAYPGPDMRWTDAVRAWLDWRLKGDRAARHLFVGAACGLCRNSDWTIRSKGLDTLNP